MIPHWSSRQSDDASWMSPSLAACSYPQSKDEISALVAAGVTVIVNLHERAQDKKVLAASGIREVHYPTRDFTAPRMEDIQTGVLAVEKLIGEGRRVAVHCGAGLGRTGTFVACYFVHTGMSANDAIEQVRRLRPGSIETRGQENRVREYEKWRSASRRS